LVMASAFATVAATASAQERGGTPGEFDFYVLALSWSPSYCEAEGDERRDIQCARPFAFVTHGLWPQHNRGWPAFCDTGGRRVPDSTINGILDVVPSRGLVIHQWRKHGSCSGLDPDRYFALTRKASQTVVIPESFREPGQARMVDPDDVEAAFRAANPAIKANAIAVTCDRRRLREVRVCLSRDLSQFVSCPEVEADACRASRTYLPAVRGR
jgi:ribonuclease T2